MKPKGGSGGKGIFILTEKEISALSENVDDYTGYIAEQVLIQHPQMASLNPTSVNTLRVMTFRGHIISCTLKIGIGNAVVDNMCSGGIYGNVNLDYGFVDSLFMDINLNRYAYHPQTHAKLLGFEIPLWGKVKETIHNAAQMIPDVQYVGWDVAVLHEDIAIIEVNKAPGHDLSAQSSMQRGLYSSIKEILKAQ